MVRLSVFVFFFWLSLTANAQDTVLHRVIFLGNAGETGDAQKFLINAASHKIIKGKTTVVFLGDNLKAGDIDSDDRTKKILESQYQPFHAQAVPVYFIPGEGDWDNRNPGGLDAVKKEWNYIHSLQDSLLQFLPVNGCPDPVEINIGDSLTIIVFDSEWWLYTFDTENPGAECDCKTKDEISSALEEIMYKNRYKTILFASHHPFKSYGSNGGYYSIKDHIFPLERFGKALYVPLPIIGTLSIFFRNIFTTPDGLRHPVYKNMRREISEITDQKENLIFISSHDGGLQFLKGNHPQVIAGISTTNNYIKSVSDTSFTNKHSGFAIMDLMNDNTLHISLYSKKDTQKAVYTYIHKHKSVNEIEDSTFSQVTADSMKVQIYPKYDSISGFHRFLMGDNYRKEWGTPVTVPVINISTAQGGLTPEKLGGGMQTRSLRLKDKDGKEWALRSIEKFPANSLPSFLHSNFAKRILKDAMSSISPFAPLIVPSLSDVAGVPHSNPIIGYVAPNSNLGVYSRKFANTVCMLEEREPAGKSENTFDVLKALAKDNDNSIDDTIFFKAKLLDVLMGDWDRHEDNWRWKVVKTEKGKKFIPVPKDRDHVFFRNAGLFPKIASRKWLTGKLRGFKPRIPIPEYSFFNGKMINGRFLTRLNYDTWMNLTHEFTNIMTDSVLEVALHDLPPNVYNLNHDVFLYNLKQRRSLLEKAMKQYYRFLNRVVDIPCSNKNERIEITDTTNKGLSVNIYKLTKEGERKQLLYSRIFEKGFTKEIRLFTGDGDDELYVNYKKSKIKFRIISSDGDKKYEIKNTGKRIKLYGAKKDIKIYGNVSRRKKIELKDSLKLSYLPSNPYNITMPLVAFTYNVDDGIMIGGGFKYTYNGFNKKQTKGILGSQAFAGRQTFLGAVSFTTGAIRLNYMGEWFKTLGAADIVLNASALVPNNKQNYFGSGNETTYDKSLNKKFYRIRFNVFDFNPALRWRNDNGSSISIGPAFQYYSYRNKENDGRFIETTSLIGTYDSLTYTREKMHVGGIITYERNKKSNQVIPAWGSYINLSLAGYEGLNKDSKSLVQLGGEIDLYKNLNPMATIIIANRIGGTVILGRPAFYQTAFLGGRENLLGFRQNRFSGQHMIYDNFEARIKIADLVSFFVPAQFGIIGFFDIGRVWELNDNSGTWHQGAGGGLYLSPSRVAVIRAQLGFSKEGMYPYVDIGFRF